jgi:thymidylate synthase ThyX
VIVIYHGEVQRLFKWSDISENACEDHMDDFFHTVQARGRCQLAKYQCEKKVCQISNSAVCAPLKKTLELWICETYKYDL